MDMRAMSSAQIKLWFVAAFAVGTLFAGVGWQLVHDRATVLEGARRTTQQLALTLETSTSAIIRSAELVAEHVETVTLANLDADGNPTNAATQFWSESLNGLSSLRGIAFIRTDGGIPITAARFSDGKVRIIDQNFDGSAWSAVTTHLSGNSLGLHIGSPIQSFLTKSNGSFR